MLFSHLLACLLLFLTGVQAHASISFPPPFRSKSNPKATNINFEINSPISAAQFPCSGEHKIGGPSAATLTAGAQSKIEFSGTAVHGGGSCQVALSYDKTNFFVIHSFMGNCPIAGGSLPFTVPSDAPLGEAVFAWTWLNKVGNREFYMNCGAVTIVAGGSTRRQAPAVPFNNRPDLFVANLDNGCTVPEGTDAIFPNPGPDVTGSGTGSAITGCQPLNGVGNSSQRGGGDATAPAPGTPESQIAVAPSSTQAAPVSQTTTFAASPTVSAPAGNAPATTSTAPSTAPTNAPAGDIPESTNGSCGAGVQQKCRAGFCCSSSGFCGSSSLHCLAGCQAGFGQCGAAARRWIPTAYDGRPQFTTGIAGRVRI